MSLVAEIPVLLIHAFLNFRIRTVSNAPPALETAQATVIYDGLCKFCTGQIDNLRRIGGNKKLRFVSLHDPEVAKNYPDLTYDQMMEQMWVIAPDGRRFGGADALRYLSTYLPLLWPIAPFLHIPGTRGLWRWAYKQIAKRRYKIAGKNCDDGGTCSLHR